MYMCLFELNKEGTFNSKTFFPDFCKKEYILLNYITKPSTKMWMLYYCLRRFINFSELNRSQFLSLPVWPVLLVLSCPGGMGSSSIHLSCPAPPTPHPGCRWRSLYRYPASHSLQPDMALWWVCTGPCQLLPRWDPSRSKLRRIGNYYVPWLTCI